MRRADALPHAATGRYHSRRVSEPSPEGRAMLGAPDRRGRPRHLRCALFVDQDQDTPDIADHGPDQKRLNLFGITERQALMVLGDGTDQDGLW